MPRSAVDATRFTSTTPYASSKSEPSTNQPSPILRVRQHNEALESSQHKVLRLRAAANRARDAQLSAFDKVIIRGRVWADIAHRFTTWSLIGATVVAGVVTVYAVGDMIIYNRRKRAEFFATQKSQYAATLLAAQMAVRDGSVSATQTELLRREDEERSRTEQKTLGRSPSNGVLARSKRFLFSNLKSQDEGEVSGRQDRNLGHDESSEDGSISRPNNLAIKASTTDMKIVGSQLGK